MITITVSVMSAKTGKPDKRERTYAVFDVDPATGELSVITDLDFMPVFRITEEGKLIMLQTK